MRGTAPRQRFVYIRWTPVLGPRRKVDRVTPSIDVVPARWRGGRHRSISAGTVNTKMLIAGGGRCGIPVAQATRSYHMLVDAGYGETSGECVGTGLNREAKDPAARQEFWDDLTELTGATYPAN